MAILTKVLAVNSSDMSASKELLALQLVACPPVNRFWLDARTAERQGDIQGILRSLRQALDKAHELQLPERMLSLLMREIDYHRMFLLPVTSILSKADLCHYFDPRDGRVVTITDLRQIPWYPRQADLAMVLGYVYKPALPYAPPERNMFLLAFRINADNTYTVAAKAELLYIENGREVEKEHYMVSYLKGGHFMARAITTLLLTGTVTSWTSSYDKGVKANHMYEWLKTNSPELRVESDEDSRCEADKENRVYRVTLRKN